VPLQQVLFDLAVTGQVHACGHGRTA
jgi:hypothetical protein